jgi:hypothetical protein
MPDPKALGDLVVAAREPALARREPDVVTARGAPIPHPLPAACHTGCAEDCSHPEHRTGGVVHA